MRLFQCLQATTRLIRYSSMLLLALEWAPLQLPAAVWRSRIVTALRLESTRRSTVGQVHNGLHLQLQVAARSLLAKDHAVARTCPWWIARTTRTAVVPIARQQSFSFNFVSFATMASRILPFVTVNKAKRSLLVSMAQAMASMAAHTQVYKAVHIRSIMVERSHRVVPVSSGARAVADGRLVNAISSP